MRATSLRLGVVVAGLLLTAAPVLAQRPEPGAGAADRGAGNGGGGAMSSGGGGGGGGNIAASGGGGSSVSSSSSGSSISSPSISSVSSPSISGGDRGFRASAPEHRLNFSESGQRQRTAPSGGGGETAAPRASGGNSGSSSSSGSSGAPARSAPAGEHAAPRGVASSNTAGRANETTAPNNPNSTREVPSWARPRGDRPATDTAVNREGPRPPRSAGDRSRDGYGGYYYDPYYYGGFGYGFGLYDQGYYGYPFYSPFGFGYGIPYGYYDPFYGDPYDYGAGYGAYSSDVYGGHDQGNLKLKVKPHSAKVYVDGYYVGTVDDFDGAFQKLTLNGGRHKVQLRADGYETTEFDVLITPQQTVTFAGDMKKAQ